MKRLVLILSILIVMVAHAKADNFVTDVMVIGGTQSETNALKTQYQNQGWTFVNQDLNQGAGGDYIYLLYKTDSDANPDATFISYFTWYSTYESQLYLAPGIMYYPVAYDGGSNFVANHGNLNNGTNGTPYYLYYTKEDNGGTDNPHLVKSITFNSNSEGAMPGIDLNFNCGNGAPEIYMHPDITQGWMFWQGNGTECMITGYDGPKAWITIYTVPSTHDGLNVIAVASFSGFINLETLVFGSDSHVTVMPKMQDCTKFKHINVRLNNVHSDQTPLSMTSIPENAFIGTAIEKLTMPSVTQVGDYAFEGCNLTDIRLIESNVQIGNHAFANISSNCTVHYVGSVNDWSPNVYVYSPNLVVNALDGACGWCGGSDATSENDLYWTLVNGHLTIDWLWSGSPEEQIISSHRWNKNNVHSLSLNHVFAIGMEEFKGYTSLTSVTIGNSVTSIGNNAFNGCSDLTSVHISDLAAWCNISFGDGSANPLYYAHHLYLNNNEITNLVIPNSVTSIKNYAFEDCTGLTSVTIPNSVTSIGNSAFEYCTGLTSVTIPNSVTSIGNSAFEDCSNLTSVTINSNAILSTNYTLYSSLKYIFGNQVTSYTIGNDVMRIGNYAFGYCKGLTSVTIGNSVTSIGNSAFEGCSGLPSVTIPNSVTSIENYAFYHCKVLKDLYFDGTAAQWNNVSKGIFWNDGVSSDCKEHWRCTVTFDANGHGTATAPQTNLWSKESKATQPTAPTASGYVFTGWYTDAQCTTPWNFSTDIVPGDMTLYAGWDLEVEGLQGSGTAEDPYLISNNGEWVWFAQSVANGTTYAGQTVKLAADIAATVMAGSHASETDYHAFSGTFDGDGHTITLALSGSGEGIALFSDLNGATLKNLKTQGTVTTNDRRPATFAIIVFGNSAITNCWSTVAVSSTRTSGWIDGGGFVGRVSTNATLNMIDCAFHGSVAFAPDVTTGGGMVGYTQSDATVNLTNCLYSPSALTLNVSQYNPRVFVSGEVSGNLTNCYYNAVAAASVLENQGTDASDMTNEALVAALGPNWTITEGLVVPKWIRTFTKSIAGYGTGNDKWAFISSPITENTNPVNVGNLVGEQIQNAPVLYNFDLYRLNNTTWENYNNPEHHNGFVLENGKGYLYASQNGTTLVFTGVMNTDTSKEVDLGKGYNLVGNPFLVNAYIDRNYYVLDENGSYIVATEVAGTTPIAPCTGVIVEAENGNEKVHFYTSAPELNGEPNHGSLQIAVNQVVEPVETPTRQEYGPSTSSGTLILDKAIVSFNEGSRLGKFHFGNSTANLYIPQSGKDYAIAFSGQQGEMPLNFEATENGTYTISVNPEGVELSYLHLIDNLTGADVDLLTPPAFSHPLTEGEAQSGAELGEETAAGRFPPLRGGQGESKQASYTFQAKTTDYASRFRLVFSTVDGPSTGSGSFAFISNGNIIINGEGTLQVIDITGRVILSGDAINQVSTSGMMSGVYVLRLIDGNDVKVQKIVIK